jgi:flagellar biosynthesis GTPase FlhF
LRPSESSTPERGDAVRTYHGRTIEELLPKIQDELGADAIIVRRRDGLTGGIAGFFQRPFVELDATMGGPSIDVYDEELEVELPEFVPEHHALPERQTIRTPEQQTVRTPFYTREPLRLSRDSRYVTEDLAALARGGTLRPSPYTALERTSGRGASESSPTERADPFAWMLERAASAGLSQPIPGGSSASAGAHAHEASPATDLRSPATDPHFAPGTNPHFASATDPRFAPGTDPRFAPGTDVHFLPAMDPHPGAARQAATPRGRAQAKIQSGLLALGVSERFAEELLDAAAVHIRPLSPRVGAAQMVRSALAQRIPVAPALPTQGGSIVLVGPGGAGKTSCCVALLGAYRKGSSLPAGCATLLGGRGKEELQMLLSPQVRKPLAADSSRALRVLRRAQSEGLLVIDTPPLSAGDRTAVRKLAGLLGELGPERVVIVLPATLGAVATAQLLEALRPLGANALALTHADETDQLGVAVEAACKFGLAPELMLRRARPGGWSIGRIDPSGLAARLVQ